MQTSRLAGLHRRYTKAGSESLQIVRVVDSGKQHKQYTFGEIVTVDKSIARICRLGGHMGVCRGMRGVSVM